MLSVGKILDSPVPLLLVVIGPILVHLINLVASSLHDVLLLVWSKTFEVVGHKSMGGKLALSGFGILSHYITHISSRNFKLILGFLIILPVGLSLSLLLSESLIIILHVFQLLIFPHGAIVLKHASHSGDGMSLVSEIFILIFIQFILKIMLSNLLFDPLFLHISILLHSSSVV